MGKNLLSFQKKLTNQQITMILNLGMKYNVKNQLLWKHLQAQIHFRLHQSMSLLINQQIQKDVKDMNNIMESLQRNSTDLFGILKQTQQQKQKKQDKNNNKKSQNNNILLPPIKNSKQISNIHKTRRQNTITNYVYRLVQSLIWYGSKNTQLMSLMLQTQIHPKYIQKNPQSLIASIQLMTYVCQVNMNHYQQNKKLYNKSATNNIQKYQSAYLSQFIPLMIQILPQFKQQDLQYLTQIFQSYPIKKRRQRYNVVTLISNQWKARQIMIDDNQKQKLQRILNKQDQKLIKQFRQSWIPLPQGQQHSTQQIFQIQQQNDQENV